MTADSGHNALSEGHQIEVLSLKTVSYPEKRIRKIPVSELVLEGNWQNTKEGYGLLAGGGSGDGSPVFSASLSRFMQAGVEVEFRTGPHAGRVNLDWDGEEISVDLYAPQAGIYFKNLFPRSDWRRADATRRVWLAAALGSDFLGLAGLLTAIGLFLANLLEGKITIRKPQLLVASILLMVVLIGAITLFDPIVKFENPQIEAVIRDALKNPQGNILQHHLGAIIKIDASGRGITDLSGIENLPKLEEIDLGSNKIVDISPLSQLDNLKKLNLENNAIVDLSPLQTLTGLEYLNINFNPAITSIGPLKNLENLKQLLMRDVPFHNATAVMAGFKNLAHLNLRNCGVEDISFLKQLDKLEYLNLYSNRGIPSISSLEHLTNLRTLILSDVEINSQIDILGNLPNLKYLNLRNTGLTDISALSKLTSLEYLNLHSNSQIQSILPLKSLKKLQTLILANVPVGNDLAIINNFLELNNLNIRNCGVSDLTAVGELMAIGRIQDNSKLGILATIDIAENPILRGAPDRYANVRPYWEKITNRQPISLPFYAGLPDPQFSRAAGFYETGFDLNLSSSDPAADIFYTLDGSEPTPSSAKYDTPLFIDSREGNPNVLSAIEAIAANWEKPENEVTKAVIVRAKAINRKTGDVSAVVTHTYFIGADIKERYQLPVVSLVTDPKNFFDENIGIYVNGKRYQEQLSLDITEDERQEFANYNQHGREWERPVSFELFEDEGYSGISLNTGVRIHGGGSRRSPQKTLRFYARPEYDSVDLIDYPLFGVGEADNESQVSQQYNAFLLRNSGQDWMHASFRDNFVQTLVNQTQLDTQAGRPVVVFINGEYWGIYTLQERYDETYLANHYGIAPENAVILRQSGVLYRGDDGEENHYQEMLRYIRKNGLSESSHYAVIKTMMDVDNYIDYLIAEIFAGNDDWPDNNIYLWRMKTDHYLPDAPYGQDGRWRWMLFDLDFGFGLQGGIDDIQENTIKVAQQDGWSGFLFRSLLENGSFRQVFISRFADQLNTIYQPDLVIAMLDRMQAELQPEMEEYIQRWSANSFSTSEWQAEVGVMRAFALQRPDAVRQHIIDEFDLAGTVKLKVMSDLEMGSIEVNSVEIASSRAGNGNFSEWEGVYFIGVPITVTAVPQPGYQFLGWAGSDSQDEALSLSLQQDLELTALFEVE